MDQKGPLLTQLIEDRSGAVLIYVGVALSVFIGVAALAMDISLGYWTNNRLQITADAAALAGASQLPNEDDVTAEAKEVAIANIPDVDGTTVLNEAIDVEIGCWDGAEFSLMPCSPPENAVRVWTRRSSVNDNPLATTFGSFFGTDSFNLVRMAVAEATISEECLIDGLVAGGIVEIGSGATLEGVCMHGQDGLKVGSDNDFTEGALSIGPGGDVDAGGNNSGLDDPMPERDLPPVDALRIDDILADIAAGNGPWPDYLNGTVASVSSLPTPPVKGTLYKLTKDVTLSGNLVGFGVYSTKKITISSDAKLHGMFLASRENVEAGSKIEFGHPDYCSTGEGSVFMAGLDQVKLGSNNDFTGVQILAGNYVDMGSNLENVAGLAVQSGGDIKMGSSHVSECERTNSALFGGSTKILHLVQ